MINKKYIFLIIFIGFFLMGCVIGLLLIGIGLYMDVKGLIIVMSFLVIKIGKVCV